ncbi:MAG TPA: GNAT family N-acetyltransferase [Actinopolymorphaceae bacterium]
MRASPVHGEVRSLGYRTDLMLLAFQGSTVTRRDGYLVVRTPNNPTFHWGNFLLLAQMPPPHDLACWIARFAAEFPTARHLAFGVDLTQAGAGDGDALAAAGLEVSQDIVLTASTLSRPERFNTEAEYRLLSSDDDWKALLSTRLAAGDDTAATHEFLERKVADERRMVEAGHGAWFGAFLGGRLRSGLGVFTDGRGLVRYQNVVTHPDARRQGLATSLVYVAGRYAATAWDARTLVIVAEPDSRAIGLYRGLGFTDTEQQIALQHENPGVRS